MYRFLLDIARFFFLGGVMYLLLLFFWGSFMPSYLKTNLKFRIGSNGHMFSRIQELKEEGLRSGEIDVLVVGSSHAYRGFDPRIFESYGLHMFNLGSSAQTHLQTKILLDRYLSEITPKVVLYEVYPFSFYSDGVESTLDLMSNDEESSSLFTLAWHQKNLQIWNTFIFRFFAIFTGQINDFVEDVNKGEDKYVKGGYVEKEIGFFSGNQSVDSFCGEFRNDQLEAFVENVHNIKSKGIELYLVQAPVTTHHRNSYCKANSYDKKMQEFAPYFNFNELVLLKDSLHFYDSHHLNQLGVEVFNKALIEVIFFSG